MIPLLLEEVLRDRGRGTNFLLDVTTIEQNLVGGKNTSKPPSFPPCYIVTRRNERYNSDSVICFFFLEAG